MRTRPSVQIARATSLAALLVLAVQPALARSPRAAAPAASTRRSSDEPSLILIVPRIGPAERAERERAERERRTATGPRLTAWCRGYRATLAPLTAATREALSSLRVAWGPASRGLGWPVSEAAATLRAASLPAPDPALDRQLRRAILRLEDGATACLQGMPTTAQLGFGAGLQLLEEAEATLALYAAEGWRCEAAAAPR